VKLSSHIARQGRRFTDWAVLACQRPARPAVLAIVAAGLALLAAGLYRPASSEPTAPPPGVIALVNGEPILMSDFMSEIEIQYTVPFDQTTPAQRAAMLHYMIDNELLVQRSVALDLPEQDTETRTVLRDSLTALITAPVLAERPSDADLKAYFDAHRANYANMGSMTLIDLVLHVGGFENADQSVDQAQADAVEAAYQLRSGAGIEEIKQHFGFVDSGSVTGEEPDFAAKLRLGPKLYAVASQLSDGGISQPVVVNDTVHLLIMQHRRQPVYNDYNSVRNNVYSDYVEEKKKEAMASYVRFLRSSAKVILAPGQHE